MAKGSRRESSTQEIAGLADAQAIDAMRGRVAVLPVGAIEQHGAHLPVSTDADIAAEISRRLCERNGYALLPAFPYGRSLEHAPRLHMSVHAATLRMVVRDIAASVADAGATALVALNAHHGNQASLERLPGSILAHSTTHSIPLVILPYWRLIDAELGHAGHTETSIMLALGRAEMARASRGYVEPPSLSPSQKKARDRRASIAFLDVAPNGVWGDPRQATRAAGEALLEEITAAAAAECERLLGSRKASGAKPRPK